MPPTDLALLILAVLCRLQTLGRADTAHDAQAAVPAILLAAYALSGVGSRAGRYAIALGAAVFIALAALPLVWLVQPTDPYDRALRSAVAEVRARTGPDKPIFAGEVRNRHAFLNPLLAYYLADRPPGVRDTMYNPGVTTTDPTQQRMVDDLQRNRVRYLILDARYADCYETWNLVGNRVPTGSTERWVRTTGWWPTMAPSSSWLCPMSRLLSSRPGTGPTRQHRPTTTPSPARGVRKSLERA